MLVFQNSQMFKGEGGGGGGGGGEVIYHGGCRACIRIIMVQAMKIRHYFQMYTSTKRFEAWQ